MKKIILLTLCVLIFNCKKNSNDTTIPNSYKTTKINKKNTKPNTTQAFLENVKNLEKDIATNPIEAFKKSASTQAKEVIYITNDNLNTSLNLAKKHTYAVITVEDHTIIKLNLKDCKPSNAWDACMPKAEGYIKKGDLIYQNDYCNNIIGLPDNQERILYLF
ncbi:hypothetical protein V6251_08305 [Olleya sp. Ti.3.14]|uniref:hypothetical protein n=1 Tax=Olleya sp. Ti.3.14 TaxID=3121297 RepID=UPI00311EF12F